MITKINFDNERMHYQIYTQDDNSLNFRYFNHPPKFMVNLSYGDLNPNKQGIFVYLPYCSYSDYDNSSSVERANYDYAISNFSHMFDNRILYKVYGGYNTTAIVCNIRRLKALLRFYPDSELTEWAEQFIEETNNLAHYPCYDDEAVSNKEEELFEEALDSYLISDCKRLIERHLENELDNYDSIPPLKMILIREYIYKYMNDSNTYPEIESGGSVYLKIEDDKFISGYLAHYDVLTGKKIYIPSEDENQLKMDI